MNEMPKPPNFHFLYKRETEGKETIRYESRTGKNKGPKIKITITFRSDGGIWPRTLKIMRFMRELSHYEYLRSEE
jgi:hypothetical protein